MKVLTTVRGKHLLCEWESNSVMNLVTKFNSGSNGLTLIRVPKLGKTRTQRTTYNTKFCWKTRSFGEAYAAAKGGGGNIKIDLTDQGCKSL